MRVFQNKSNSIVVTKQSGYDYLKIIGSNTFSAPILDFSVNQATDCNIHKSLDNNFTISYFGDKPVGISVSGLVVTSRSNSCASDLPKVQTIQNFYDKNKNKLINISIDGSVYKCYLISLKLRSMDQKYPGIINYSLQLLGKRI